MDSNDKYIWPVFWTAAIIFILTVLDIFFKSPLHIGMPFLWFILFLIGLLLLILSIRSAMNEKLKLSLTICGAALAAIPLFILLHNLIYSVIVQKQQYGIMTFEGNRDEPVFLILAVMVCPIVYMAGAVASIILRVKSRHDARRD